MSPNRQMSFTRSKIGGIRGAKPVSANPAWNIGAEIEIALENTTPRNIKKIEKQ